MVDRQEHTASLPLRILRIAGLVLAGVVVLVCLVLFFSERWMFHTWSLIDMDEIIFHLSTSIEGTNPEMVSDYIWHYGVWIALVFLAFVLLIVFTHRRRTAQRLIVFAGLAVGLGLMEFALIDANARIGMVDYLRDLASPQVDTGDFYYDNYVDPAETEITFPEEKRNLIYIFLESVEMTYADEKSGGAFEKNAIPELTKLAQKYEDFSGESKLLNGALPVRGTTWTMGAMFGQSCGLPLKLPISGNGMEYQVESNFFPSLTSLGDLLKGAGYHQVLMFGSDATFAGRDTYFSMHGDYEIQDYHYMQENGLLPQEYYVFWGYEDQKLFQYAKDELEQLAAGEEPFNLTLLTVDTHFEDGYVCPLCKEEFGDNQYANVMACSSRQVAEFVSWVQKQDFYENTTIVICGDHLTMDKNFCADVPEDYERRTFTAFINSAAEPVDATRTRSYTTLDMFPTTLASLGVTIKGNRLGLGTNLFSVKDTLLEQYGKKELDRLLHDKSAFMNQFMNIEITEENMQQAAAKAVLINRVESSGKVTFIVDRAYSINSDSVENAVLELTNAEGQTTSYSMTVWQPENDPNVFNCYIKTNLTEEDLRGIHAAAYFSVAGFDHYLIAEKDFD